MTVTGRCVGWMVYSVKHDRLVSVFHQARRTVERYAAVLRAQFPKEGYTLAAVVIVAKRKGKS